MMREYFRNNSFELTRILIFLFPLAYAGLVVLGFMLSDKVGLSLIEMVIMILLFSVWHILPFVLLYTSRVGMKSGLEDKWYKVGFYFGIFYTFVSVVALFYVSPLIKDSIKIFFIILSICCEPFHNWLLHSLYGDLL